MKGSRVSSSQSARLIIPVSVILIILVSLTIFFFVTRKPAGQPHASVGEAPLSVNADPAATWPIFSYRPFELTAAFPPGMTICQNGDRGFSIRNDACGSSTKPTFSVRWNEAWNKVEVVSAFNDAYAQELREAGLESVAERAERLSGKGTTIVLYQLSDVVSGAIVAESRESEGTARKVAVDIRRDVPPESVNGLTDGAEQMMRLFLQNVTFTARGTTTSAERATTTSSSWSTYTNTERGYHIDYPMASVAVPATPPADLSVQFGTTARLEVRSSTTVDVTRGSTEGYQKLNEKTIDIKGMRYTEERYFNGEDMNARVLFVPFTRDDRVVGITLTFGGDPAEEQTFETILSSFSFSQSSG